MKTLSHLFLAGALLLLCLNCSGDDVNNEPESITGNDPVVEVPDDTPPPPEPTEPTSEPTEPTSEPTEPSPHDDLAAQIIYTDIEPDFTPDIQNTSFGLDLNNDQLVDYVLEWKKFDNNYEWLEIRSNPSDQNGIISVAPWYTNPVPLSLNTEIFTNPDRVISNQGLFYGTWGFFTIGDCFGGEPSCFYDWKAVGERFLGLRFTINGKVHYGWARIEITDPAVWVLKDYAYNATPNNPVQAGRY